MGAVGRGGGTSERTFAIAKGGLDQGREGAGEFSPPSTPKCRLNVLSAR